MTTVPHDTAHTRLLAALQHHGCRRDRPGSWTCPAHPDHNASLSVTPKDDRVLVRCHAGCTIDQITTALGLSKSDLFDRDPNRDTPTRRNGHSIIATYPYTDEAGTLLFEVCRLAPKDFRQRAPDGQGGWTWTTRDIRRVPYRLDRVLETARQGGTIHIVEGEKDVHAIEAAGGVATTSPGGAGKWRTDYNPHFTGAHIVIVADNDRPGLDHAETIRSNLTSIAASVTVVRAASGKDAADHLAEGHTLNDFINLDQPQRTLTFHSARDLLAATPPDFKWVWQDYVAHGSTTILAGSPKAGKSTLLFGLINAITSGGKRFIGHDTADTNVVLLSEEGPVTLRPKLERLTEKALDRVRLVTRDDATPRRFTWPEATHEAVREALDHNAGVVIIDTLSFWSEIKDENDATEMTRAVTALAEITSQGLAVILVHHHRKSGGDYDQALRGNSALGAAADMIINLVRPQEDTEEDSAVRELRAVGRFPDAPEVLQTRLAQDGNYRVIAEGSRAHVKKNATRHVVAAYLRETHPDTSTAAEVQRDTESRASQVKDALKTLVGEGIAERFGSGGRQDPFRYRHVLTEEEM